MCHHPESWLMWIAQAGGRAATLPERGEGEDDAGI